jgi:hypothetical protein
MSNSNQANEVKKPRGGMIFYPRNYVLDTVDAEHSYAEGVNQNGEACVVYLNPDLKARENAKNSNTAQSIPRFEEFAETHRRAMHPCFCAETNGPDSPSGIMLLEQISEFNDSPKQHSCPVYVSKWASVLRDWPDAPQAPVGLGYLEINFNPKVSPEVNEYMQQYNDIDAELKSGVFESVIDAEEKKQKLHDLIMAGKHKWFVAALLKIDELTLVSKPSESSFSDVLLPIMSKYTFKGMYAGAIIRVRKGNQVISSLCAHCDMQFDYKKKDIMDPKEVVSNFLKWDGRKIINEARQDPSLIVEIIPVQRINCGKLGNDKYSKEFACGNSNIPNPVPKVLKTYVDRDLHGNPFSNYKKEKAFLFSNIAIRVAEIRSNKGEGNILVSSIHAFSAPIGNIFSVDKTGNSVYVMDNKKVVA